MQTFIFLFGFPDEHPIAYCMDIIYGYQEDTSTGGYVCSLSITVIFTTLSAFVQSGPNQPRMTEVALGEEICASIVQGTVSLYYNWEPF